MGRAGTWGARFPKQPAIVKPAKPDFQETLAIADSPLFYGFASSRSPRVQLESYTTRSTAVRTWHAL